MPGPGHTLTDADRLELGFLFAPPATDSSDAARPFVDTFSEEDLLYALRRELRLNENHVVSVTALDAETRRVDVRLSQAAAKALWKKCREQTLSADAPAFVALVATNGDRLNRDGTLVSASDGSSDGGGGGGGAVAEESVEGMFEKMAAEEKRREEAMAERRRLEKEEEARMEEIQEQLRAQHDEHLAIKQAKKDKLRKEQARREWQRAVSYTHLTLPTIYSV